MITAEVAPASIVFATVDSVALKSWHVVASVNVAGFRHDLSGDRNATLRVRLGNLQLLQLLLLQLNIPFEHLDALFALLSDVGDLDHFWRNGHYWMLGCCNLEHLPLRGDRMVIIDAILLLSLLLLRLCCLILFGGN